LSRVRRDLEVDLVDPVLCGVGIPVLGDVDLKSATRCGMGPCGGRSCEDAAALLIAARTGRTREAIGQATGRPPLRPVTLQALAGAFDVDALPMTEPAPL